MLAQLVTLVSSDYALCIRSDLRQQTTHSPPSALLCEPAPQPCLNKHGQNFCRNKIILLGDCLVQAGYSDLNAISSTTRRPRGVPS